jgi:hypothetical protein
MVQPIPTSEYLLLLRGTHFDAALSPQEMQEVMGRFTEWFERLSREGKLKAGQPLANEGRVITGRKGRAISDGPFVESKEAVGGYIVLSVPNFEEAVALAEECPLLDFGCAVEVRPIVEQCAELQRVQGMLAAAQK